jgi:hypothetical protein
MSVKSNIGLIDDGLKWHFDPAHAVTQAGTASNIARTYHRVRERGDMRNGATFSSANGGSFSFDGSNDYIEYTNASLANVTGDMTIIAWVYPTGFPSGQSSICTWANVYNNNTEFNFHFNLSSTYIRLNAGIRGNQTINTSISLNEWVQVAVTYDASAGDAEFFKNGSSVGSITSYTAGNRYDATGNPSQRFSVSRTSGQWWKGNIGPIMIYDRILSSSEMERSYNALKNRFI